MAGPFNRLGVKNEAFRRNSGVQLPNKQGNSASNPSNEFSDLLKKHSMSNEAIRARDEEAAFRDWAKNRPLKRRDPSVPSLPRNLERAANNRAREIASKIIRTGLRIHPFRLVFQAVLDWLVKWLIDWLIQWAHARGGRPWRKYGECANPGVGIAPDFFAFFSSISPPSATQIAQANSCLGGQGVTKTNARPDLVPISDNENTCYEYRPKGQTATSWTNCTVKAVWGRPSQTNKLPTLYLPPASHQPSIDLLPAPKRWIAPYLVPDYRSVIQPDILPPESVEPDPPSKDEPEPHKEIDVSPGTKTRVVLSYRYRVRTRTREKEKKFAGSKEVVRKIFTEVSRRKEQLSEADDFLDTLFDALPKEIQDSVPKRNGRVTPDLKMKHIYDNFDKIDWSDWVKNVVENYIEDKIVGKAIAASDKAALGRGATNTTSSRWWLHGAR